MKEDLPGYQPFQLPNGEPFAAADITVYSYLTEDTRRRSLAIEGLPADWPKQACPVCGGWKRRGRRLCRRCFDEVRRIMVRLACCYCGVQFERIFYEYDKQHRRGN